MPPGGPPCVGNGKVIKWRSPPVTYRSQPPVQYTEAPSVCQTPPFSEMTDTQIELRRPKRADARPQLRQARRGRPRGVLDRRPRRRRSRRWPRRAGPVGIGTLYRNFPTRQALLEAVYLEEVEGKARAASKLSDVPPWDALSRWLHRYVGFAATKRALNEALVDVDPDSDALQACRAVLLEAGTVLVERRSARRRHPPGHDLCGRWPDGERDRDGADRRPRSSRSGCLSLALDGLRYRTGGYPGPRREGGAPGGVCRRRRPGRAGRRSPALAGRDLVCRLGAAGGGRASCAHEGRDDRAPHGRVAEAHGLAETILARGWPVGMCEFRVDGEAFVLDYASALWRARPLHLPAAGAGWRLGRAAACGRRRCSLWGRGDPRRTA